MNPMTFLDPSTMGVAMFTAIVFATFVSEDLTCLAAGLLVASNRLDWFPAVAGCFVGISVGDASVWLVGRIAGRRVASWQWVRRQAALTRFAKYSNWLSRYGGLTAFASRFLPGTRVPLLVAAGIAQYGGTRYLLWAILAALVWAPLVVLSVAHLGKTIPGWLVLLGFISVFLVLRIVPALFTRIGRAKLVATVSKVWRWEFWPTWVFYLPLVPWLLYLSVRYRSCTVWTAANPGIPAGGVVGESKFDILSQLPSESIIPTFLIPPGEHTVRAKLACDTISERGWSYPLVLKPDAGQRGVGVKKAHNSVEVEKYLLATSGSVLAQPYHAGPFEAGVFYFRIPGEKQGQIFSITDKVFPVVVGDGRSTLEEFIWAHPRFRMQAATFLARHAVDADRVLSEGEAFPLALAGNHCQGTLFCDGCNLATPELCTAFDAIVKRFDGFFVGRFDVRYADPEAFKTGRGFAIVELNGVTSESTNLYDPSWSIWRAYRTLFRQWSILFRIGHLNRTLGHVPLALQDLMLLVRSYYLNRDVVRTSD